MLGRLLVIAGIIWLGINLKLILGIIVLMCIGFNLIHGKSNFPKDYYRKSKRPVQWQKGIDPWYVWGKKCNPIWWMLNDDDPVLPLPEGYIVTLRGEVRPPEYGPRIKNDWFRSTWPQWLRLIGWGWRNPTCNFDRYVLGFWDKQDWWARERHLRGLGEYGEMFPLPGERFAICAPFLSVYMGKGWEFYTGWKPNSEFGWVCLRRKV